MENLSGSIGPLAIIIALIVATAFFVATEFSLIAVRQSRVEQLKEEGTFAGKLLHKVKHGIDGYITAAQLGITACTLVLGSYGEPYISHLIEPGLVKLFGVFGESVAKTIAYVVSVVLVTFITVLFAEQIPKIAALKQAERFALATVFPLDLFYKLVYPLVWLFTVSTNFFLKAFGGNANHSHTMVGSPEEFLYIVQASSKDGVLDKAEGEIISQVLELEETSVREIMVPRVDVVAVESHTTLKSFWEVAKRHRYSRVPVYEGSIDNIVGLVYIKDLLDVAPEQLAIMNVTAICHKPYFVPETLGARQLLDEMRKRKTHMAIVVDEFKGTAGVVTLEDVVEEILGEIYDESDDENDDLNITQAAPGIWEVEASTPLEEISELLTIAIPDGEYDTLSGFLMDKFNHIPAEGERYEFKNYHFIVTAADPRGIETVRIEKITAPDQALEPA